MTTTLARRNRRQSPLVEQLRAAQAAEPAVDEPRRELLERHASGERIDPQETLDALACAGWTIEEFDSHLRTFLAGLVPKLSQIVDGGRKRENPLLRDAARRQAKSNVSRGTQVDPPALALSNSDTVSSSSSPLVRDAERRRAAASKG